MELDFAKTLKERSEIITDITDIYCMLLSDETINQKELLSYTKTYESVISYFTAIENPNTLNNFDNKLEEDIVIIWYFLNKL